ncbi:MAG: DMT family transporter [Formosimonas sp.]
MSRTRANLLLLLCACVWGVAFVPQAFAAPYIGAFAFTGARFLLGALVISPLVWREWRRLAVKPNGQNWRQIALMGGLLFAGATVQQIGMQYTSVTNAGFLTGLYVPMVPFLAYFLYKRRANLWVWLAALTCFVGTWLLTGAGQISLNLGDLWVLGAVIPFALHVLWIGDLADNLGAPLLVAWGQFVVCGILGLGFAVPLESFNWGNLPVLLAPMAYMSLISVGIGFTGQVIAQQFARPAEAAIILSSESVFAALAGATLLNERLTFTGYLGCALIFAGIIAVQIIPSKPTPLIEQH